MLLENAMPGVQCDGSTPVIFKSGQVVYAQARCDGCKRLVPERSVKLVYPGTVWEQLLCKKCREEVK